MLANDLKKGYDDRQVMTTRQKAWAYAQRKERTLAYRRTPEGKIDYMMGKVRKSAKKHGVENTLTKAWLKKHLAAETCEVTGMTFVWPNGEKQVKGLKFASNPWSPSVDRIVAGGPYSNSNCRVTTWIYNSMRGRWSDDDIAIMCRAFLTARDG